MCLPGHTPGAENSTNLSDFPLHRLWRVVILSPLYKLPTVTLLGLKHGLSVRVAVCVCTSYVPKALLQSPEPSAAPLPRAPLFEGERAGELFRSI